MSNKPFEDMGYLILFGLILCFIWPVVGIALIGLALAGIVFLSFDREHIVARHRRALATAAIIERADRQHAAALSGDPYGTYGDYPPAA